MYIATTLLTTLILYPLAVLSQATPTAPALPADQTIVPFKTLPACASNCGLLFDVQGKCAPSQIGSADVTTCFCSDPRLQPFYTTTAGVCDSACTDADSLNKIKEWFVGLCSNQKGATPTTDAAGATQPASTATGTAAPGSQTNSSASSGGSNNGTWISTHWQWIVMIVVLSLAIIIGWIAACFFRRRYIRRKEREFELRPPAVPWVAGQTGAPVVSPYGDGALRKGKDKEATAGMFVSRPPQAARMSEKPAKKWVVKERT